MSWRPGKASGFFSFGSGPYIRRSALPVKKLTKPGGAGKPEKPFGQISEGKLWYLKKYMNCAQKLDSLY
jgi:hypothetical protein